MRIVKLSDLSEEDKKRIQERQIQNLRINGQNRIEANKKFNELINQKGEFDTSRHTSTVGKLQKAYKNNETVNKSLNDYYKNNTTSLWKGTQNFSDVTGKIGENTYKGAENGILSAIQNLGRNMFNLQGRKEEENIFDKVNKQILDNRKDLSSEEKTNIIDKMNNFSFSQKNLIKGIEEKNQKFQEKKNENTLKIQQNADSISNPVGKYLAGEIAPGIGQMLPGMLPGIGTTYFISSATGNYHDDAIQRGMTEDQATIYSGTMGIIEGALESLGANLTKNVGKQLLKKNIKGALVNYGLDIGENFLEESIVEPISEIAAQVYGGKDKADWSSVGQRMIESGVAGALTSAITGGASAMIGGIGSKVNQQNQYVDYNTNKKLNKDSQNWLKQAENIIQENSTPKLSPQLAQNQQNTSAQQITPTIQNNVQNRISEQTNSMLNNKEVPMLNYQYEKSDNVKINNLRQDAGKYFNNSEQARNYVNLLEQIITDKNVDIRLNDNLKTPDGKMANGSYSDGVITINPNSTKSGEFIAVHELTHAIGTDSMRNIIETYRKSNTEFNTAMENLLQNYNSTELTDEALSDVSAQLFGNQEFIANVSQSNPNIFKRIYNEIKYLWHQFRGYKNQNQFIDDLYYKWTQAYNSNSKLNEASNYSIAGKEGMTNAIKADTRNLALERNYNKAQQMQKSGIDNETIRQNTGWFQDRNGDWKFEFSDKDMSLKNIKLEKDKTYKLGDILEHDTLFDIYPELANYNVKFTDLNKPNGVYNIFDKDIKINNNQLNKKQYKSSIEGTLIHEIQHAIQDIENFEGGKSSKGSKLAYYESLGEIEASDTKARFLQEKHNNIDLADIAPESSKLNPKHKNLDRYLNNRKLLDKAKDGVYNYIKKRNGGSYEFSKENISKNKKQNMGLVDGRKRGRYVDEYEIENITNIGKNNEKNISENNKEDRGVYRDRVNKKIQESENNSGSFSFDKNARRYEDLEIANTVKFNKKADGTINIEISDNNELINQFTVFSKESASKQLGNNIADYIYNNATEDSKVINLKQKENVEFQDTSNKAKQLEIIKKTNPMLDDYHVGIRNIDDIKTFDEVINDEESFAWGDFTKKDAERALKKGKITIYSSYPIEQGTFVSTSKIQAEQYAGGKGNKVYSKTIPLEDVAWINGDEGQYANVNQKYSLQSKDWQQYLNKNFKSTGTRTNLQDIKNIAPIAKEVKNNAPIKNTSNMQVQQEKVKAPISGDVKTPKTLNPTEISNLKPSDASTTPKLPNINYEKGNKQSSFFGNVVTDAKFLNQDLRQELGKEDNIRYYKGITNQETLEKAYNSLNKDGEKATLNWISKDTKNINAEDVAKGWILLKQYQDNGDYQGAVEIAKKMRQMATEAGQTVQAYNILSRLTPEGMFYYAQSELTEAYNKMVEGKSQKWIEENRDKFELTPTETQFIMNNMKDVANMEDGYDKKVKLAEIQSMLKNKIPPTTGQSIKAWMRISMLFNPKTQVRNVSGNAVVLPVNISGDIIASGVDKLISQKTGVRTTGNFNIKNYSKGFGQGLYESYNDFKKGINTREIEGNRFEISEGKSFKDKGIGKALNRVDNLLSFMLDAGDRGFYEATFTNSINNQLVLNNTTEVTQDMIDIATNEALQRTWQDNNKYTEAVLKIRNILNYANIKGYGLGDVLIPFAKTPANLTKAIVDYSPFGLLKAVTVDTKKFKNSLGNGQYTPQMQHKLVQNIGKGIAGSFLYVLGYALAKAGIASGEADDDKDVKNFMKNSLGISSYSIKIGDKSFTYDWAQPVATPLAIATNFVKYSEDNPDANIIEKAIKSLNIGTEQLLQQSFMESLNTVLNGNGTTLENLSQAVLELPARAIPTFSKQIADMVDRTQRTSFEYDKPLQSAINSVVAKIPVASKTLPVARDTLGNEIKKYGGENDLFNVMFNPANVNKGQLSKAGEEIYRLYKETGETGVFPITAPYYINSDGEKITMTAEERSNYQKVTGEYSEKVIKELLNNTTYKSLSDEKKAEFIKDIISDSNAKAKYDILDIESDDAKNKRELIEKINTKNYYDYKMKTKDIEGEDATRKKNEALLNSNYSNNVKETLYQNTVGKEDSLYNILSNGNIDINEYLDYKIRDSKDEFVSDKDSEGKTISGSAKNKIYDYVNKNITGTGNKLIILGSKYKLTDNERKELTDYINTTISNKDEKIEIFKKLDKNYTVKDGKVYYK